MFSVIIPLYNKAPYVVKALRSVMSQTFREFEVIIIDDGSTDQSYEVAQNFILQTTNFKLHTQPNQGVSVARNNGVKIAQYPYICFLDADDWWAPTFLEEMKALIEEFPDAGIYGSSYYKVKDSKNIPANIGVEKDFERGLINYCQVYAKTLWMPLWTGTVVIHKKIYEEEGGFKPNLKLGEDFDLWIRIAMKHPVAYLNKPLAYYNQDVDITFRAIGRKFYKPEEHMLFTDYGEWMNDKDFRFLFERLALYGLLPYYLENKNNVKVKDILNKIDFEKHEKKYWWYYKALPKWIVKGWFEFKRLGIEVARSITK
jgi:glycosyltransferase involved in cell wall biosynthesis